MYVYSSQNTQGWKKQDILFMLLTKKNHCLWAPPVWFCTSSPKFLLCNGGMGHMYSLWTIIISALPIWLPICFVLSTQYISIAPSLPWQISECWFLFPRCRSSCTNSEREKKSLTPHKSILWALSIHRTGLYACARSLIYQVLMSASCSFILIFFEEFHFWMLYLHHFYPSSSPIQCLLCPSIPP